MLPLSINLRRAAQRRGDLGWTGKVLAPRRTPRVLRHSTSEVVTATIHAVSRCMRRTILTFPKISDCYSKSSNYLYLFGAGAPHAASAWKLFMSLDTVHCIVKRFGSRGKLPQSILHKYEDNGP